MQEHREEDLKLLAGVLPNVSLQLRNSMTNLSSAFGQLLPPEEREADPEADHLAAIVYHNYYQMYRLLSNLNEVSRLPDGWHFELYDDDVVGLCRRIYRESEFLFEQRGVTLEFLSDRDGRVISMDVDALRRLVLNLLSNALKFTPKGGTVRIHLRTEGSFVKLSVSDTGCGISADRLDHLFDRFLDTGRIDPPPHGLGLGLAICRGIARGHGGTIVVQSEVGKGSTFTVSLPSVHTGRVRTAERRFDYTGGFNPTLIELSDALGTDAFTAKLMD